MIMEPQTSKKTGLPVIFLGVIALAPAVFFFYYSIRLLYVNLTMPAAEAAAHRTGGMLIGAIAFPLATFVFGLSSFLLIRAGVRRLRSK